MDGADRPLRRRLLKFVLSLLAIGALCYLLLLVLLFFTQTRVLFPGAFGPAPPLPAATQRLALSVQDGDRLHGVHIPPEPGMQGDEPVIIGFGGNAWNAEAMALTLHDLFPEADVVAFHYRGYPPSTGSPGAAALLGDASLILDLVTKRFPRRRVVAIGFSVGAAPAARLALDGRVSGVILVTPFDSLRNLAQSHFRWAPVGLLLRQRFDPAADLRQSKVPVAVIAAEHDEIVPARSTRALAAVIPHLVLDEVIPECDHNSIYAHPAFAEAMRKAIGLVA